MDRVFTVTGLDAISGPTGTSQTIYLASIAQDQTTGFRIPQVFQSHESVPGLFVQTVNVEPQANSRINAVVKCHYKWQSFGLGSIQVKITGTRNVLHANRDPTSGQLFVVNYTCPAGQPGGGIAVKQPTGMAVSFIINDVVPKKIVSQLCEFNVSNFHLVLEVQRVEKGSPKKKAVSYVGSVNSEVGWQGVGSPKPALWMCQSIEGSVIQPGFWNVTYVLEYAPEGWWQIGLYQDPANHLIPSDVLNDPGIKAITGPNGPGILRTGPVGLPGQNSLNGELGYSPRLTAFNGLNLPEV